MKGSCASCFWKPTKHHSVSLENQHSMKIYEAWAAFDAEELENGESRCPPIDLAIVVGEEISPEGRFGITLSLADLG